MRQDSIGWAGGPGGRAQPSPSAFLRRSWQDLRSGDALPRRDALAPRSLAPILSCLLLVERWAGGVFVIRYAGMDVIDLQAQDLTDRPLTLLFDPSAWPHLMQAMTQVMEGLRTVEMDLVSERGFIRPSLDARLTFLPIRSGPADRISAIGCLDLDGPVILPPRRFRIERVLGEPLAPQPGLPAPPRPEAPPSLALAWSR